MGCGMSSLIQQGDGEVSCVCVVWWLRGRSDGFLEGEIINGRERCRGGGGGEREGGGGGGGGGGGEETKPTPK